jgi:hypothetical protein
LQIYDRNKYYIIEVPDIKERMAGFELVLYNPSNKAESSFSVGSGI